MACNITRTEQCKQYRNVYMYTILTRPIEHSTIHNIIRLWVIDSLGEALCLFTQKA